MRNNSQTYCQSLLLAAISSFQWTFAMFVTAPPPYLTFKAKIINGKKYQLVRLLFALYSLILVGLTLLSCYMNSITIINAVDKLKLDGVTYILSRSCAVVVPFVQVLSQLTTLLGHRQLKRIFGDIELLEHDIRWRPLLPPSSADETFGRSFHWQLLSKSGSLMVLILVIYTATAYMLTAGDMALQYRLLATFFSLLIQIKSVEFCAAVQMVQALLQQLLEDLRYVRLQITAAPILAAERRQFYAALKSNQELLSRIWQLVDIMESYFSIPILVLFLYNTLTITDTVNWAYVHQKRSPNHVVTHNYYRLIHTGVILICMLVPCWLCQTCIQTYEQFAIELHNLRSNGSDMRLSYCIREYSLQMMHQKLLFTCGGLFDINLQHFGSRILTITTYVVILIQFKLQGEAEKAKRGEEENILQ